MLPAGFHARSSISSPQDRPNTCHSHSGFRRPNTHSSFFTLRPRNTDSEKEKGPVMGKGPARAMTTDSATGFRPQRLELADFELERSRNASILLVVMTCLRPWEAGDPRMG